MLVYPSYANTGFRKSWCRFCDNSPPFANNQNSKNSNMSFLDSKSYPTKYKPDTVRFVFFRIPDSTNDTDFRFVVYIPHSNWTVKSSVWPT